MRSAACLLTWLALLASPGKTLAQNASEQPEFTITDNVENVLLDVSVRKAKGGYASGLAKKDFSVYDDGRLQPLTYFSAQDAPVTVGLIVDDSGSMNLKRPEVVMAGLAFAKSSNPQDEFFVINFNDKAFSGMPAGVPFTDKLQVLRQALFFGKPAGRTALYDAIAMGLEHLKLAHQQLKTLIVVSDGGDNASRIQLSGLLNLVRSSSATIYAVGLLDPDDQDLKPAVLRKLSSVSGGEFFEPKKLSEILPTFQQISNDIRHRYTVGFIPSEQNDIRGVHTLIVKVHDDSGTKYVVNTRKYYRSRESASS